MIATLVDTMRPADAYRLGYEDCLRELELQAQPAAILHAARLAGGLEGILSGLERIAPWPEPARLARVREDEALAVANGDAR